MSTITAQVRTHPNLGNQSPSGEAFPLIWPLHSPRKLEKHVSDCNDEKVRGQSAKDYKKVPQEDNVSTPSYKGSNSIAISCSTVLVVESKLQQFPQGNRFVLSPLIPVPAPVTCPSVCPSMHCENPLPPYLRFTFSSSPHFPSLFTELRKSTWVQNI